MIIHEFLPDMSSVAEPIQQLTRKNVIFQWGAEQEAEA